MYTTGEYENINQEFKTRQQGHQKKLVKIWSTLLIVVTLVIIVLIIIFPNQFKNEDTAWILPVYGGLAFIATLLGTIISISYKGLKPFYLYVYDEVIQKINLNEGLFLEYRSYVKDDKEFNNEGGLFTRFANVNVFRMISGTTENEIRYKTYDCIMTTSSGKSQQTHFAGIYYVLEKNANTSLQVRSNGSPKHKGVKFDKQDRYPDLKVFKEENQTINSVDEKFIRFMEKLDSDPTYKRVYLSVIHNQIHLALWYQKHPTRKQKNELSIDLLNYLEEYFMSEYHLVNELDMIDNY